MRKRTKQIICILMIALLFITNVVVNVENAVAAEDATVATEAAPAEATPATYTVTICNADGAAISEQKVAQGGLVTQPGTPEAPAGKEFAGWKVEGSGADFNFAQDVVAQDMKIVPTYTDIPVVAEAAPEAVTPEAATETAPETVVSKEDGAEKEVVHSPSEDSAKKVEQSAADESDATKTEAVPDKKVKQSVAADTVTALKEQEGESTENESSEPEEQNGTEEGDEETPETEALCKVTFVVDEQVVDEIEVEKGVLVTFPENDPVSTETPNKPFLGWYADGEDLPFSTERCVEGDVTLIAKFSEKLLVTYLNSDGRELQVFEIDPESAIPHTTREVTRVNGQKLDYWMLEGTDTEYDIDTELPTESIRLVPKLTNVNMVIFITQGTEIAPQEVDSGYATKPADPSRDGYEFAGWYTKKDTTEAADEFDFEHTKIENTTYVYAGWIPKTTSCRVNFWVEKLNYEDLVKGNPYDERLYDLAYSQEKQNVISGSNLVVVANSSDKTSSTDIVANEATTYAGAGAGKELLDYSEYKWSDCAKVEKKIAGNGTTVVNIYYNRIEYTINFDYGHKFGSLTKPNGGDAGDTTLIKGNGIADSSTNKIYTIKVRYGETLTDKWPQDVTVANSTSVFKNWSGYWGNGARVMGWKDMWIAFLLTPQKPQMYYTNPQAGRTNCTEVTVYPSIGAAAYTEQRYYYVEMTTEEEIVAAEQEMGMARTDFPTGEAGAVSTEKGVVKKYARWKVQSGLYAGERYYKLERTGGVNAQSGNPTTSAKGWPGASIPGYEAIGASTDQSSACLTTNYQQVFVPDSQKAKAYRINYFMPAIEYVVTLSTDGNFGNPGGYDGTQSGWVKKFKIGQPVNLPEPTKPNNIFKGWYFDEAFQTKCENYIMPANAVMLYARFDGMDVKIVYHDGQSVVNEANYSYGQSFRGYEFETGSRYDGLQVGDELDDKIFQGWCYQVGSGAASASIEFPVGVELTKAQYDLYATWKDKTYTVKYMNEDDTLSKTTTVTSSNNTLAKSNQREYKIAAPTGYDFKGWNTQKDQRIVNFSTATVVKADVDVYPVFTPTKYSIKCIANGGKWEPGDENPSSYNIESNEIELTNPERTGYEFIGWTGTGLSMPEMNVTIAQRSIGNREYSANWNVIPYTITYDLAAGTLNSGTNNPTTYNIETGDFTLNNPVRKGYDFVGWTGTDLSDTTQMVKIAKGSIDARSYTAHWVPSRYSIKYDLAGGNLNSGDNNPVEYNIETASFALSNPVREGYDFTGWTGTDLTAKTQTVEVAQGSTGDRSYQANWKRKAAVRGEEHESPTPTPKAKPSIKPTTTPTGTAKAKVLGEDKANKTQEKVTSTKRYSTSATKTTSSPKTGDENPLGIWLMLMAVGCSSVVYLVLSKRRSRTK